VVDSWRSTEGAKELVEIPRSGIKCICEPHRHSYVGAGCPTELCASVPPCCMFPFGNRDLTRCDNPVTHSHPSSLLSAVPVSKSEHALPHLNSFFTHPLSDLFPAQHFFYHAENSLHPLTLEERQRGNEWDHAGYVYHTRNSVRPLRGGLEVATREGCVCVKKTTTRTHTGSVSSELTVTSRMH
jgi:hypothetical protein